MQGQKIVAPAQRGRLTVTYLHGFATVPERLVEIVCSIASRMETEPVGLALGARSEGADGEQTTWGVDAYDAVAGLRQSEKDVLDEIFPHSHKVPSVAVTM
jgi:hypothetical protein